LILFVLVQFQNEYMTAKRESHGVPETPEITINIYKHRNSRRSGTQEVDRNSIPAYRAGSPWRIRSCSKNSTNLPMTDNCVLPQADNSTSISGRPSDQPPSVIPTPDRPWPNLLRRHGTTRYNRYPDNVQSAVPIPNRPENKVKSGCCCMCPLDSYSIIGTIYFDFWRVTSEETYNSNQKI